MAFELELTNQAGYQAYQLGQNERWRLMPRQLNFMVGAAVAVKAEIGDRLETRAGAVHMVPKGLIKSVERNFSFFTHSEEFMLSQFPKGITISLRHNDVLNWDEYRHACGACEKYTICVEEGAQATLIHHVYSMPGQRSLDIHVAPGARLDHIMAVKHEENDFGYLYDRVLLCEGAVYHLSMAANVTGKLRHVIQVELNGEGSSSSFNAVNKCSDTSQFYGHFDVYHHAEQTQSSQRFQSFLYDRSTHGILSSVVMNEQAVKAASFQRIDHLLLSDHAKAFSKPSLDIDIDDVSSEHGATVGWMDEQALMYMQARGLTLEEAKKVYMNAKVDSIYQGQINSHVGFLKKCLGPEHE